MVANSRHRLPRDEDIGDISFVCEWNSHEEAVSVKKEEGSKRKRKPCRRQTTRNQEIDSSQFSDYWHIKIYTFYTRSWCPLQNLSAITFLSQYISKVKEVLFIYRSLHMSLASCCFCSSCLGLPVYHRASMGTQKSWGGVTDSWWNVPGMETTRPEEKGCLGRRNGRQWRNTHSYCDDENPHVRVKQTWN